MAHLPDQTLEQLAEGTLPAAEAALARAHLEACGRCFAELEGYQSLFAMLGQLPRFAPSPVFADAVMARVRVAQQESPVVAWLKRLVPSTKRGWALIGVVVTAPAAPIALIMAWLLTQPLLSPVTLWQWAWPQMQSAGQAALAWVMGQALDSIVLGWAEAVYTTLQTVPSTTLGTGAALVGVAIPLSGWGFLRLVRTPVGSVNYAK